MKDVRKTRKFGGKIYRQHDWYTSKLVANTAANNLKAQGYSARVTLRPKSKTGMSGQGEARSGITTKDSPLN